MYDTHISCPCTLGIGDQVGRKPIIVFSFMMVRRLLYYQLQQCLCLPLCLPLPLDFSPVPFSSVSLEFSAGNQHTIDPCWRAFRLRFIDCSSRSQGFFGLICNTMESTNYFIQIDPNAYLLYAAGVASGYAYAWLTTTNHNPCSCITCRCASDFRPFRRDFLWSLYLFWELACDWCTFFLRDSAVIPPTRPVRPSVRLMWLAVAPVISEKAFSERLLVISVPFSER